MNLFRKNKIIKETIKKRNTKLISFVNLPNELDLKRIYYSKEFNNLNLKYNAYIYEKKIKKDYYAKGHAIKALAYDLSFKKLLSENKGIISSFLKLIKDPSLKKIKDPKGNYLI
ncbi:MAG: hypothetical protein PHR26_04235, partial [Candidatus ainarchaeum sp.]|nr:hypothetical protein [Candidatus ainarchaeum sp.]